MKHQAGHKRYFGICLSCFSLLGISFLLMPIEGSASVQKYIPILLGMLFWLSLIGGIVSYVCFAAEIKKQAGQKRKLRSKIGLICFFQNRYAGIADVTMFFSVIALITTVLLTNGTGYICYLFTALLVWSFSMHCICNGGVFCRWIRQNQDSCVKKESAAGRKGKK